VVTHLDGQPVLPRLPGQAARHRPRPQHAVLLQPEVEVVPWLLVFVKNESGPVHFFTIGTFPADHPLPA
jgi:hypothetical protein